MKQTDNRPRSAIKPRERDTIIRSLRSGVVPAVGLQHIQVGRHEEVASFLRDIESICHGGSSFRIVVGEYGSGKTFFLSLARSIALEKGLVTMHADLTASRRLHGSHDEGRLLLGQLISSLSTRTKRDGNALEGVLDRLRARIEEGGERVRQYLEPLAILPGGHAFAKVVEMAIADDSGYRHDDALRWLRAEYGTRTDAQRDLGIRDLLGRDGDLLNAFRLYAKLALLAGFKGLYVTLDELVNLYKIINAQSRKANYEEILSMLNNTLQGNAENLGIVLGVTPETLTDPRRGFYSYEALRSRLAENSLASTVGLKDFDSTVLRLANLTPEELYVLLGNLRELYASEDPSMRDRLPDEALEEFLRYCFDKIGESYFRTPRNTIKAFLDLASLLRQYPEATWQQLLPDIPVAPDRAPDDAPSSAPQASEEPVPDDLVNLKL